MHYEALLYAASEDEYRSLPEVTAGLVFLGTPFRGTRWKFFADSAARLMQLPGSHRGIIRELDFDEPVLLDKLHFFCRLCNRLSTPVSCFSELYEIDYGRRFGIDGLAKGIVRLESRRRKRHAHIPRWWTRPLLVFPASTDTPCRQTI
jgi:hypothetical protein